MSSWRIFGAQSWISCRRSRGAVSWRRGLAGGGGGVEWEVSRRKGFGLWVQITVEGATQDDK